VRPGSILKRFGATVGAVALTTGTILGAVALGAGTASATPQPGAPSSACTYTDGSSSGADLITIKPGDTINISCTGLPASTSLAIAPASGLGGIVTPASDASNEADIGAAILTDTSSSTGTLTASFTWPATFSANDANAACPPTQAQINAGIYDCIVAIADLTTQVPLNVVQVVFSGEAAPAAGTLTTTGFTSGAPGDSVTLSKATNLWGSAIEGAGETGTSVPAASITLGATEIGNTVVSPASYAYEGALTQSAITSTAVTIPAGTAAGTYPLCVNEPNVAAALSGYSGYPAGTAVSDCVNYTVLRTPTLSASPTSGAIGQTIAVTGSNWDPNLGTTAALSFTDGTDTGTATVSATGALSGTITVGSSETATIPTGQLSTPDNIVATLGTETESATFTVVGLKYTCSTSGSPSSCNINQAISVTVSGVTDGLILNEGTSGTTVTMAPITLNGYQQTSTGSLNPVTLIDERGTLVGWSTVAQFQADNFTGPVAGSAADHEIPATNFFLGDGTTAPAPNVACSSASQAPLGQPSCLISEVTQPKANVAVPGPSGTAVSLGNAKAGGGGGSFLITSGVQLYVPSYIAAGTYSDTLNITVS